MPNAWCLLPRPWVAAGRRGSNPDWSSARCLLRLVLSVSLLLRLVLSSVSDYFAAMFTNDVLEAKQEEIKMEGVDPEALRSLVHFAYTGECS